MKHGTSSLWDGAKAILGGRIIALNAYTRIELKWSMISYLSFYLNKQEENSKFNAN